MPILLRCLDCGALTPQSRCPRCLGNTSWNGKRDRATQARFRKRILTQAGNQCQAIENGQRCPVTTNLQAHHINELDGLALCRHHHKQIDTRAR